MRTEYLVDFATGDVSSNPVDIDAITAEYDRRLQEDEQLLLEDDSLFEEEYEPADFSGVSGDR